MREQWNGSFVQRSFWTHKGKATQERVLLKTRCDVTFLRYKSFSLTARLRASPGESDRAAASADGIGATAASDRADAGFDAVL